MWVRLASIILRNRLVLLCVLSLMTAFMAYEATSVKLSYEFAQVLPETDSSDIGYKKFKQIFGDDGNVLAIGFTDSSFYEVNKYNALYDLSEKIKNIDGIEQVVSVGRLYYFERNDSTESFDFKPLVVKKPGNQIEMDSLRDRIYTLPFYDRLVYNRETKSYVVAVTFDKIKLNTKSRIDIIKQIREYADAFGSQFKLDLHYSGMPFIRTAISRKIAHELVLFLCLALAVTAIVLWFFFRSLYVVFFALLVVTVGVVWSLGSIELLDYRITILTGLIPPLIIIIGVPNSILLLNKYQQEYRRHGNKIRALARTVEKIGITVFLANVTTAIGFGVFYFTHSRILMEFGLIASMNVMVTYLISLILIPIVFSYLPAPSDKHVKHLKAKFITWFLTGVDNWVHHYRTIVYLIVIVVTAISIYGVTLINPIAYVVDDLPKKDPVQQDLMYFQKNYKGVLPFEISIDTKKKNGVFINNASTIYKIKALEKYLDEFDSFAKPLSIVEPIAFSYQAYNYYKPKKDGTQRYLLPPPTELDKLRSYFNNSRVKEGKFRSFLDSTRQFTRVSIQMADVGSVRMRSLVDSIRPKVDSIFPADKYDVKLTGNSLMFLRGNDYLIENLKQSVILAILLITFIMAMLFMSFRMIAISILPSIIPLVITAGLMGFFHIAIKPSTILIFSIAFGITSDGTMYFLTKYRQELKIHKFGISKSVSITIKETGVSMVYTAVILFFGFFIFVASGFGGTANLGLLVSLTLLVGYLSNLVLLPCFLLTLEKKLTTRAFLADPLIQLYDEEEDVDSDELEIKRPPPPTPPLTPPQKGRGIPE